MAAVDPYAAVVSFLLADADVADLAGARVFGGELPREENAQMPRAAVVVKPAGGGLMGHAQRYGDKRVDTDCYGATLHDAHALHLAVRAAMKGLQREVHAGVLLHWARVSADGATGHDPDTDWPMAIASYQVLASEIAIT